MNYGSGLMLGMGIAQAVKSFLSGGTFAPMGSPMRGRMNYNYMDGAMPMLGGRDMGKNKKNAPDVLNFPSSQIPQTLPISAPPKASFELVSALPGRRRYRASFISKELAVIMEENLTKLDYVKSVSVNSDTGSILILFDEGDLDKIDELAHWIKKHLFSENYAEYKRDRKLNQIFYGSITKSVKSTLRHISHMLIRETHGLFDIRSLSSAIFAIFGFRKVILNGEFPSGIQMLWWAVSLMRGTKGV